MSHITIDPDFPPTAMTGLGRELARAVRRGWLHPLLAALILRDAARAVRR